MLTLFEELFLLTIDDERGIVISPKSDRLRYGLSGAILDELAILGKICIGEKGRLELADTAETGDNFLDRAMGDISESERNSGKKGDRHKKVTYWVDYLGEKPKKRWEQISQRMVDKGILNREGKHFLWVIPSPEYPELNAPAKQGIKGHLRSIILTGAEADLRSLALLSLLQASKLLNLVFTKDERQAARQRIYEKITSEAMNNPVAQAVQDIKEGVATTLADSAG